MSLPATLDVDHYQGDDWFLLVEVQDSDGNAVDISGHDFWAQIRIAATSVDVETEIEIDDGEANLGVLRLHIAPEVTAELPLKCHWDLQMASQQATPVITTLLAGKFTITRQITR